MKFDEWWESRVWQPIGAKDIARDAWNAAVREYANEVLVPILQVAQGYLADVEKITVRRERHEGKQGTG